MANLQAPRQIEGLPLSLDQIEALVQSLYQPGQGQRIAETEATLMVLQRSPQGWDLADALLQSQDEQVRFFGALTLTVKLNSETGHLDEQASHHLLEKLICHVLRNRDFALVTRKLCSTLALYFCRPATTFRHIIMALASSLVANQPRPEEFDSAPYPVPPESLNEEHMLVLLEFATNLAEEAKKLTQSVDDPTHKRVLANLPSVENLLQRSFVKGMQLMATIGPEAAQANETGERLCKAALKCFVSWIFYGQEQFRDDPSQLNYLRSVIEFAFMCFENNVDDAVEIMTDVLESYPKFFELAHLNMLWKTITSPWGVEILRSGDAECSMLARLAVAYAQILLEKKVLYREPHSDNHDQVMVLLHNLLKYPSPVGMEDDVAPLAIEFWTTYTSAISEENFELPQEKPAWMATAKNHALSAIYELLQKVVYPPPEVAGTWDKEAKNTFHAFRLDVQDLLQDAYDFLQATLLEQLINFAVQSLAAKDWFALEASLFALNAISDLLTETTDAYIQHLFQQQLFVLMTTDTQIPSKTRRSTVDTVAKFKEFFVRNPQFLPEALRFLLSALEQPRLAQSAAKSFSSLCFSCRKTLTGELASFFQMYEQFLGYQTAEQETKSRILGGISAIVQAQDSNEKKLAGINQMFLYISQEATRAVQIASEGGDPEQGQVLALSTLRCLSAIGEGLQASDEEAIIDLDGEQTSTEQSDYWIQGPGKPVQNQIINFITYLVGVFTNSGEIIEAACDVLRSGYKEAVPGPFVLPPGATVNFVLKTNTSTPRLPHVLSTASVFVSSHKLDKSAEYSMEAQRLLHHVLNIMQMLEHPRTDPEIAVCCIELIQKFINCNAQVLQAEAPTVLKAMFDFSIECLHAPEVLPKRAAAALWKDIFELCSNTQSPHQATGQEIVDHFGQAVATALVSNVCGGVGGSALDHICAPMRKLILSTRQARAYITTALDNQWIIHEAAKDDATTGNMVRMFVEGAMRNARNSTAFKETVRTFWMKCKQLQMQFAVPIHVQHRLNEFTST